MNDKEDDLNTVSFDELEESENEENPNDSYGDDNRDDLESSDWEERLGMDEEEIEKDPWDLN